MLRFHSTTIACLATIFIAIGAPAQTVVLDFNDAGHGGSGFDTVDNSAGMPDLYTYQADDFTLSIGDTTGGGLGNWGSASGNFLVDPVAGSGSSGTWLQLSHDAGNEFAVNSIDVVDFLATHAAGNGANASQVTFYGFKQDASVVSSTFAFTTSAFDKEAHTFGTDFGELVTFAWNQNSAGEPVAGAAANRVHMVDNINVTVGSEPPPPTVVPTIVAFGDSTTAPRNVSAGSSGRPLSGITTEGLNQADPANPPHNVVNTVIGQTGDLYVYTDVLRDELADFLVPFEAADNEGIGGNRTDQAVARLNSDVRAKDPEIVIVQYGINDSAHDAGPGTASRVALDFDEQTGGDGILGNGNDHPFASRGNYTDNLTQVVQTLRGDGVDVIVMTPNQVIDYNVVTGARLSQYADVARDIAGSEGAQLLDVWQRYQDFVDAGGTLSALLLDSVHPNGDGQRLVAEGLMPLIAANWGVTFSGDINGDGVVDEDDVDVFVLNWLNNDTGATLAEKQSHGDMNFDGIVNLNDAYILHEALAEAGVDVPLSQLMVPEPASAALVVPTCLVLFLGRRRPAVQLAARSCNHKTTRPAEGGTDAPSS